MELTQFKPRLVLSQNLKALLTSKHGPSTQSELKRQSGLAQSTIGRALSGETAATVDTVEQIAKAYGLEAWQLLVAGMDPSNPPVLQAVSAQEKALYERLRETVEGIAAMKLPDYKKI